MSGPAILNLRAPRSAPEAVLQKQVAANLRAQLPTAIWWTASLSGVRLTPAIAGQAKAAGMEKGAPDISAVLPDGSTIYVELKAPGGTMTPEQSALAYTLGDSFALCQSWPEVKAAFERWLAPHGLRFLTDTESLKREIARRAA